MHGGAVAVGRAGQGQVHQGVQDRRGLWPGPLAAAPPPPPPATRGADATGAAPAGSVGEGLPALHPAAQQVSVSARTRVNWPRPSNSAMHYIYPAHLYPPRRPAHRRTAFQLTSAAVCLKVAVCKPLMMTRGSAFAGVLRPTLRRWNLVRAWQSTCLGLARLAAQRSRLTHEPQKFRCDVVICGYSKVMEKGDLLPQRCCGRRGVLCSRCIARPLLCPGARCVRRYLLFCCPLSCRPRCLARLAKVLDAPRAPRTRRANSITPRKETRGGLGEA